jgi:hypothetical protein
MNRAEFMDMHAECVTAMRTYFVQVERTSTMLAECTVEPLTFAERLRLMSQGITENDAHLAYLGARSLLVSAARLGYALSN